VASEEQSRGIEEVNHAVSLMNNVVQANVASTEELSAQSEELNGQVGVLLEIVEGDSGGSMSAMTSSARKKTPKSFSSKKALPVPKKQTGKQNPEDVIPMNDDDFEDF
jgi:hypothetical protein